MEVGCGFGGLGKMLLQAGLDWEGIEHSSECLEHCVSRGLPVRSANVADLSESRYGAVVMAFVFEHLVDFGAFLGECKKALVPGGQLLTLQPTASFARIVGGAMRRKGELPKAGTAFVPPWHTVLFSIEGMECLCKRHGFEVADVLPSVSGRVGSLIHRTCQWAFERINSIGFSMVGRSWPLAAAHLFVLRKEAAGRAASCPGKGSL
jgi:SAM-dependent methyltransferase